MNAYNHQMPIHKLVFRHFDSASMVKGLIGVQPKTAWIIDYSLLERIHYLLVAGFDVYGDYERLLDKYGIRRTNPSFWSFSDVLIKQYKINYPIESGILDYNRLQNR
ncbi:hypothetical protein PBPRB0669 [Photobacterium profundum SS9]|uniref:Uncharacterized protein n=1 Tax=Photobacterium profundum (strain SS9) TaxID=298386 RepID=Q6LJI8_PHOPR|nr:hypothetical protein PBPRB0669 [Photobacterium profundum SS9]